ncbi:MAG TPA: homoserine dehydrogenase [Terriglobales bacterium]|jgi:homoserine dehydrogenase|nr:homoserine dehydrogenase [Terriglobales bacterium]
MATHALLVDNKPSILPSVGARKIAILGFGTVGSSVARILSEGRVAGLELSQVFNRKVERKRASWVNPDVQWTENFEDVLASDADFVVEVMGGVEPARQWVKAILQSGRSVVTANKQLIARHGAELSEIAEKHDCQLLFGASVAGGVPVITALEHGLAGDEIQSVCGILNGTCNYILNKMEGGESFPVALEQAQRLGYAEADPTDDIAGYDTRAKLVILARVALRAEIPLDDVVCQPVSCVDPVDFEYARELGCTIRQVGYAEVEADGCSAAVEPMLVPASSPLARAQGCENVVLTDGKFGGSNAFSGPGAGGNATAVAVISDLVTLAHATNANPKTRERRALHVSSECTARYFLRFVVRDRPGIVAAIAAALAKFEINVDAVFQKPGYDKGRLPFVVTVEACSKAKLQAALDEIALCGFLVEPPLKLRIFGH